MEHESFENEETAKVLNAEFVAIKVDREERPDVDRVYVKPQFLALKQRNVLVADVICAGNEWSWWLADERVLDSRSEAVLWRNLFSSRGEIWNACIQKHLGLHCSHMEE